MAADDRGSASDWPRLGELCCDVAMATEIQRVNVEMSEKTDIGKVN